jgi:hypothetical protein
MAQNDQESKTAKFQKDRKKAFTMLGLCTRNPKRRDSLVMQNMTLLEVNDMDWEYLGSIVHSKFVRENLIADLKDEGDKVFMETLCGTAALVVLYHYPEKINNRLITGIKESIECSKIEKLQELIGHFQRVTAKLPLTEDYTLENYQDEIKSHLKVKFPQSEKAKEAKKKLAEKINEAFRLEDSLV